MRESVRPTSAMVPGVEDNADACEGAEISDEILDSWMKDGDRPFLCAALIKRMQLAANHALTTKEDKIIMPTAILDLYEISVGRFEHTLEQFQDFCAKYFIDPAKYLEFNHKLAKGKPVEFDRMRTLMHITLLLLCEKLNIDKNIFQNDRNGSLFVVGGALYTQAQSLADSLHQKIGY